MIAVEEFYWDETNEKKVQDHGLSADDVDALLLAGPFVVFANRKGLPGSYQLVGRDLNGRYVTVIIQPVPGVPGGWRPVTAWLSKKGEMTKAQHQGV
ncbi:MAG: hypothetical protein IT304_05555 [Dehalococcoidia bacterium]|nr:hypothetical protein [Dehalococcoidia bacterium]